MLTGLLFLFISGLCWSVIGIIISRAARKKSDCDLIQGIAALICVTVAAVVILLKAESGLFSSKLWVTYLLIFMAGVLNYLMLKLMNYGMGQGHNGAVWGITQSALIFPFMMGIAFFGVELTGRRLAGLLIILVAIFFFSSAQKHKPSVKGSEWLKFAVGAFICAGLSQCFANMPSYMSITGIDTISRTLLVQFGVLTAFSINRTVKREGKSVRPCILPALLLALINIVTLFIFFYRGLNIMAELGMGSIGYPIAMGTCIAFFSVYSSFHLKEKNSVLSKLALFLVITGIVVISG